MSELFNTDLITILFNAWISTIFYDIWFYGTHVILHTPLLYKIHKFHHSKPNPTYRDVNVGHPFDNVFQSSGAVIPAFIFNHSIYSLLLFEAYICLRGLAQHDARCSWLIGNHHLLHHKYGTNCYGQYWIDWLFGTLHPNESEYKTGWLYR